MDAINLTKAKKDEIKKKVREIMEIEGKNYDDWQSQNDLNYLLDNLDKLGKKRIGGPM